MATDAAENEALLQEDTRKDYGSMGQRQRNSHQLPRFSDVFRSHLRQDDNDHDFSDVVFPRFWESMKRKTVIGVHLDLKSEEARLVAWMFHQSVSNKITRILRIQNPRLWAHYYRKRKQMQRDHGGKKVLEYRLFHGTEPRRVDSICRKGFEVGRAGSCHGSYLGKGIYFAADSLWANVYSQYSTSERCPQILTSPLVTFASMDTREFSEITYNLGWHYANPLISSLECSGSEGDEIHFYNQREEEDSPHSEDACENEKRKAMNSATMGPRLPILADRLVRPLVPEKVFRKTIAAAASTSKAAETMPVTGASRREESKPTTTDLSSRPAARNQDTLVCVQGDEDRASTSPLIAPTAATTQSPAASNTAAMRADFITSHRCYTFLSSVLVGSTVQGQGNVIMPPLVDASNPDSPRHDSCYGWMPSYLEFVVFRNNQAYPEYLIEYSHEDEPEITIWQRIASTVCLALLLFVCVFMIVIILRSELN